MLLILSLVEDRNIGIMSLLMITRFNLYFSLFQPSRQKKHKFDEQNTSYENRSLKADEELALQLLSGNS